MKINTAEFTKEMLDEYNELKDQLENGYVVDENSIKLKRFEYENTSDFDGVEYVTQKHNSTEKRNVFLSNELLEQIINVWHSRPQYQNKI